LQLPFLLLLGLFLPSWLPWPHLYQILRFVYFPFLLHEGLVFPFVIVAAFHVFYFYYLPFLASPLPFCPKQAWQLLF